MSKRDVIRMCLAELPEDEGIRSLPYRDHLEYRTIGIGFLIHFPGKCVHPDLEPYARGEKYLMDPDEAKRILREILVREYDACARVFEDISVFESFTVGQRASILNLYYQLGDDRFRGFKKMIAALCQHDWENAQKEARDSLWFNQTQSSRTTRVIDGLMP